MMKECIVYKIETTGYGIRLTFSGFINRAEMEQWASEFIATVDQQGEKFKVFVDMRGLKTLPPESQDAMEHGQSHAREAGMERSVVILNDKITTMQFRRIAKQTGIYAWERYIDADKEANWQQLGLDWILNSVDPDQVSEERHAYQA
jgi:hypothetical protein